MVALRTKKPQFGQKMGIDLPDGSRRWLFINSVLTNQISDSTSTYVVTTFRDITEEKKAIECVRHTNDQLIENQKQLEDAIHFQKLVTDNSPALIAYWDKDEICRFANRAYRDWFNKDESQLIGQTLMSLLGEEVYEKNQIYIKGALSGKEQSFSRDLVKQSTGETRYTSAHYVPNIKNGSVMGFVVLVFDVTELQKAQQTAQEEGACPSFS